MSVLTKINQFLNKPFPQEESVSDTFKIVATISIFVALFLYIFKPFGMHLLESGLLIICLGFGAVTFITSMVYESLMVYLLRFKGAGAKFTFGRWILYFIGVMLFISVANFLFIRIVLFGDIQWALFPPMLRGTFSIGLFPAIVIGALALLSQEKKYQKIASELNQSETNANVSEPTNGNTIFNIPVDRVRYIEAMQNYIKIGHIDPNGQLREQSERATLKSISSADLGDSVLKCHRSFLVNREFICSTAGNSQGLLLTLRDCAKQIPVSRSYVPSFREK